MPEPQPSPLSFAFAHRSPHLTVFDLGEIAFTQALALQVHLNQAVREHRRADTVLLLEHHPAVVTLGRRGTAGDLLAGEAGLAQRGVELAVVDRGGQATLHARGQLVAYLIIDLGSAQRHLRQFVAALEGAVIGLLRSRIGIEARVEAGLPGVWVGNAKLAALGISVRQGVTMHGLALNVDLDLSLYSLIVPCGIQDRPPTSIAAILESSTGAVPTMGELKIWLADALVHAYGYSDWSPGDPADFTAGPP